MFAPAHLRAPRRDRAILGGLLVALAASAWLALWLWEGSPYGRYLHHDGRRRAAARSRRPLLRRRLGPDDRRDDAAEQRAARRDLRGARPAAPAARRCSSALLLVGYLARLGRLRARGVGRWIGGSTPPSTPCRGSPRIPQLIIGATLLGAGLWQFSPLRDRCLDECRSPLGFVMNRWRGVSERREAFAMGIAHGAFCVGCCWSLMLVMFGVGLGEPQPRCSSSAALTAIEKNLPSGRRLTRPLGVVLVLAAVYAVAA